MSMLSIGSAEQPTEPTSFQEGYTRLTMTLLCHGSAAETRRVYNDERRSALRRFFAGKSISRVLTVRTSLSRPRVSTTVAAITADYESSKGVGESWNSEFNGTLTLTPYFRVDPDNMVSLKAELRASSSYDSNLARGSLDLIKRAASLVAPGASLLTSLNEGRFNDASQFVDQSISSMLRESIVERSGSDFPLASWAGRDLAYVTVRLPIGNEITPGPKNKSEQQPKLLGVWLIRSEPTVMSVFTNVRVADTDSHQELRDRFQLLTPHMVLNFRVDGDITLSDALAADSGVAAARDRLVSTRATGGTERAVESEATRNNDARNLCMLVADRAEKLGFNRIDVAAAVWAYSRQNFVASEVGEALRKVENCPPLAVAQQHGLPQDDAY